MCIRDSSWTRRAPYRRLRDRPPESPPPTDAEPTDAPESLEARTPPPVSYTHLDVYKRQELRREIRKGIDSGPATPLEMEDIKARDRQRLAAQHSEG